MNKKGQLGKWFIGIIIVMILIWFLDTKVVGNENFLGQLENIKENIMGNTPKNTAKESNNSLISSNTDSKENTLMDKCLKSFNECRDISEAKYGRSVSLINKEVVVDSSEAEKFFGVWSGPYQMSFDYEFDSDYPSVLFAIRRDMVDIDLPFVLFCNSNGELTNKSKGTLQCG